MKNVLVVDNLRIIFEGLESRFNSRFNLFFAKNSRNARTIALENEVDAVILDMIIGTEHGLNLAFDLKKAVPKIFFFSMQKSPIMIRQVIHYGYDGFFLKDESIDELIRALDNPQIPRFWMSDAVKTILEKRQFNDDEKYDKLTPREQQIFLMIAEGMKPLEIADKINISTKTISVHRDNLMHKMEVKSTSGIVRLAIKLGILEL